MELHPQLSDFLSGEKPFVIVSFSAARVSVTGVYSVCDLLVVVLSDALAQNLRAFNARLRAAVQQVGAQRAQALAGS